MSTYYLLIITAFAAIMYLLRGFYLGWQEKVAHDAEARKLVVARAQAMRMVGDRRHRRNAYPRSSKGIAVRR